ERRMARAAAKDVVISLRRIALAASAADFDGAAAEYKTYYDLTFSRAMPLMRGTEPWSLFNPSIRAAHDAERRRLLRAPAPTHAQRGVSERHDESRRILDALAFAGHDRGAGDRVAAGRRSATRGHRRELSTLPDRRHRPVARRRAHPA